MAEHQRQWEILVENGEAVVAALERGECAGILPHGRGFLDGFAGFLLEAAVLDMRARAFVSEPACSDRIRKGSGGLWTSRPFLQES